MDPRTPSSSLRHQQQPQSHPQQQHPKTESPLASLVRRASSRRAKNGLQSSTTDPSVLPRIQKVASTIIEQDEVSSQRSPVSPLLHTCFRGSTGTALTSNFGDANSYMIDEDYPFGDGYPGNEIERAYTPGASNFRDSSATYGRPHNFARPQTGDGGVAAMRESSKIQSLASAYSDYDLDDITAHYRDSFRPNDIHQAPARPSQDSQTIPTVRVSSVGGAPALHQHPSAFSSTYPNPPSYPNANSGAASQPYPYGHLDIAGLHESPPPSRLPASTKAANFSRPVPPVIDGTEERKRQVIMRNQGHHLPQSQPGSSPGHTYPSSPLVPSSLGPSNGYPPAQSRSQSPANPPSAAQLLSEMASQPYSYNGISTLLPHQDSSRSNSPNLGTSRRAVSPSGSVGGPQQRVGTPSSVYSSYSYYPYEETNTPPNGSMSHLSPPNGGPFMSPNTPRSPPASSSHLSPQHQQSPSHHSSPHKSSEPPPPSNPQTPQDYLQLGISHHLANELPQSAACFEKAATMNGGCGVGMLMWGLTLRHGWGVEMSEAKGFKWLRRAAELAVGDLEKAQGVGGEREKGSNSELDIGAVKVRNSFDLDLEYEDWDLVLFSPLWDRRNLYWQYMKLARVSLEDGE